MPQNPKSVNINVDPTYNNMSVLQPTTLPNLNTNATDSFTSSVVAPGKVYANTTPGINNQITKISNVIYVNTFQIVPTGPEESINFIKNGQLTGVEQLKFDDTTNTLITTNEFLNANLIVEGHTFLGPITSITILGGSNNDVLTTNGSGTLSWANIHDTIPPSDWNAVSGSTRILNKPTIPDGTYANLSGKPNLSTVATTGSYTDLTNTPIIPGNTSQLINDSGYVTSSSLTWSNISGKPSIPTLVQSNWTQTDNSQYDYIKNKPTFSTVATSGSYNDLSNKPTIPDGTYANLSGKPNLSTVATSGSYNDLNSKPNIPATITDLNIIDGTNGQVLTTYGNGKYYFSTVSGGGGTYGNSNVANYLPEFTGNITANVITANIYTSPTNSNLTLKTHAIYNITTITNGGTTYTSGSGTPTTGGSGVGMTVNINQSGGVVDLVIVNNPGTGYANGDTITVLGGDGTATFTIANYSATDTDVTKNWIFSKDGNLTAPGNILMSNISGIYSSTAGYTVGLQMSNTEPSVKLVANDHKWQFNSDGVLKLPAPYSTAYPAITMTESANLLIQGYRASGFSENGGDVIVSGGSAGDGGNNGNATVFGQQVTIQTQLSTDLGSPTYNWTFDADGNLSVPGGGSVYNTGAGTSGITANITSGNAFLGLDDTDSTATLFGNAGVQIGTNVSVAWNFTASGNLTLPNGAVIKDTAGDAVAFGQEAGQTGQSANAVAIGQQAGSDTQGVNAVAIGALAGEYTQGANAVAVGFGSGYNTQGLQAVAIGQRAGEEVQGNSAVAIGAYAGQANQGDNSIIINATGAQLNQTTANTFTVAPVRNDVANIAEVMFYNATSKEVTYGNTISVSGNVTAGNIYANNIVAEASFSIQTANFNANVGGRYGVNTTGGAVTATLPATPATGGAIFFADAGGAFASNNLTINPNGQTIMGASGNMTVSNNNQSFGLFFNGTTWRTYN